MIEIHLGGFSATLQLIPIYGLSAGLLYYNPRLEPDVDEVPEEEMYHQITLMFFAFGLHITVWES